MRSAIIDVLPPKLRRALAKLGVRACRRERTTGRLMDGRMTHKGRSREAAAANGKFRHATPVSSPSSRVSPPKNAATWEMWNTGVWHST